MADFPYITLTGVVPSDVIDLRDRTITRIQMPAAWTDADLHFLEAFGSTDTFQALHDANGDRTYVRADASRMILLDARQFQSSRLLKIVSSVSQGGARILRLEVQLLSSLVYTGGGLGGTVL